LKVIKVFFAVYQFFHIDALPIVTAAKIIFKFCELVLFCFTIFILLLLLFSYFSLFFDHF